MNAHDPQPKKSEGDRVAPARWKRLLPITIEGRPGNPTLRVLWVRLALLLFGFTLLTYLGLVTGLWVFLNYQRGLTDTRLVDLLIPSRWAVQRQRTGNHYIANASLQLEAGQPRDALISLRIGVAKSPANVPGRILLARLFVAARRHDLAEQTLLAGIPFVGQEPSFLRGLFDFLLLQQKDDFARAHARELLGAGQLSPEGVSLVALAAASASYFRGNYDEAENFLRTHRLDRTYEGRLLSAQIEWARGYRELALVRLRTLVDEFPANDPARAQLAPWLRELGRTDEFRRLTLLRQIAQPASPAPRIDLLRAFRDDDPAHAASEADALLREFSGDEKILLALADYAADLGEVPLARKIYEHCRRQNLAWEAAAFLTVESMIVARDYRGALDFTHELLESNRDWAKRYYPLFDSLQSIAYYGLGDTASAQLHLAKFLGQADLRADNLRAVAQRFVDVGASAQARETLARAVVADPLNQAALTQLIQLDLELNQIDALTANLRHLLAMRRPSPVVLRSALGKLGSDLFLFSRERDEILVALQRALAAASPPSAFRP